MRFILIGPPGSGKGTQAQWMNQHYGIFHLSTGDMLRQMLSQPSPLAKTIQSTIDKGALISDDLITQLVQQRISQPDCANGFILDGFPRTLRQAQKLHEQTLAIDIVFEFVIDEQVIIDRLDGRRIHPSSGRVYHVKSFKDNEPVQDRMTGDLLIKRPDDDASVVKKRLETYRQTIQPVIDFYQTWARSAQANAPAYCQISSEGDAQEIRKQITHLIEK